MGHPPMASPDGEDAVVTAKPVFLLPVGSRAGLAIAAGPPGRAGSAIACGGML